MKRLQILLVGIILIGFVLAMWWQHSPFYHEVRTATTFMSIDASAEKTVQVLTDFEKYPEWNPYIVKVAPQGQASTSPRRFRVVERAAGRSSSHTVQLVSIDKHGFEWTGHSWPGFLLNWTERFTVVPVDSSHCRLEVAQSYQGVLLRSYWNYYNHRYLAAVKEMGKE